MPNPPLKSMFPPKTSTSKKKFITWSVEDNGIGVLALVEGTLEEAIASLPGGRDGDRPRKKAEGAFDVGDDSVYDCSSRAAMAKLGEGIMNNVEGAGSRIRMQAED